MLANEPGTFLQDFPVVVFELESNEEIVQAESYALEFSVWLPNGTDFIINVFETQGFSKSLDN